MYEYIRGKLISTLPNKAVVDVQGVGYAIAIALSTYGRLPKTGQEVTLYVAHIVREDAQLLYGFLTLQERDFFYALTNVSGIGPKTAMTLLGHVEVNDLQMAILAGNNALLSKVPGIGKKTAERLVIELRDKVEKGPIHPIAGEKGVVADAISALVNLGYHPAAAQKAVQQAIGEESTPDLSRLIAQALRWIK